MDTPPSSYPARIVRPVGVVAEKEERAILVVDDMPEICEYFTSLAKRIKAFNIVLTTEVNSRRALAIVAEQSFDIVVSDFRMREVDGVEVLKAAYENHPRGFRVLMTGYNEIPTSIERIREARVDAYIQKPLKSQDLLMLLMDFVQGNEAAIAATRAQARELELVGLREERHRGRTGPATFPG